MLSQFFLGMSLAGAEWVLYFLILLSILSVALVIERIRFFRSASRGLVDFRQQVRSAAEKKQWTEALKLAEERQKQSPDLESGLVAALISHQTRAEGSCASSVLNEVASDCVCKNRLLWDRNLALLATIGSNAPFVGLFGTVLGIIKAFHDLSKQVGAGAQSVTSGISEALVATAVGILVAVPAVVAFNLFQRRVKTAVAHAEALKSFLIGKLAK